MSQGHKGPPKGTTMIYLGLDFSKSPKGNFFGVFSIMACLKKKKRKEKGKGKGKGEKRKVILLNHSCIHRLNTKEYKGSHENHK